MSIKIRQRIHLITYYRLVPNIAFAIILMFFSSFGLNDEFRVGAFLFIVITSVLHALMALFEPWFTELEIIDNNINYTTSFGGTVCVNLEKLEPNESYVNRSSIYLTDINKQSIFISCKLYSKSDIKQVLKYLGAGIDS